MAHTNKIETRSISTETKQQRISRKHNYVSRETLTTVNTLKLKRELSEKQKQLADMSAGLIEGSDSKIKAITDRIIDIENLLGEDEFSYSDVG